MTKQYRYEDIVEFVQSEIDWELTDEQLGIIAGMMTMYCVWKHNPKLEESDVKFIVKTFVKCTEASQELTEGKAA